MPKNPQPQLSLRNRVNCLQPTEVVRDRFFVRSLARRRARHGGFDARRGTPLGIDKEVYLNDKTELKRLVNIGFDRVRDLLNAMTADDLAAEGRLFGRIPLPKWQIIEAAFEHGIWTLGQTVPYVRLQGGTPHSFSIVPAAN